MTPKLQPDPRYSEDRQTRGLGPCPACNRKQWWFNDIPLRGFCWGPRNAAHPEVSIEVPPPFNPYLGRKGKTGAGLSDLFREGTPVRKGRVTGYTTGRTHTCRPGCTGARIGIRWPSKGQKRTRVTYHCINELRVDRILFRF